jgi:hypothetical protein
MIENGNVLCSTGEEELLSVLVNKEFDEIAPTLAQDLDSSSRAFLARLLDHLCPSSPRVWTSVSEVAEDYDPHRAISLARLFMVMEEQDRAQILALTTRIVRRDVYVGGGGRWETSRVTAL